MANKYDQLHEYKFDDLGQMIRFLQNNGYCFKIDSETKKDVYVLEKGEYRDKSHHFEIGEVTYKSGNTFFVLNKKD